MPPRFRTSLLAACLFALACLPATALAGSGGVSPSDARYQPAKKAKIVNGMAIAPRGAPAPVVNAIAAANKIIRKPYRYGGGHGSFHDSGHDSSRPGGGHGSFNDSGYDCSGSVSYALHGGGLLRSPLDSSSFMHWGYGGRGKWITIYTNPGHAYVYIAGLRLDTGQRNKATGAAPGSGPRWNYGARSNSGFTARHPNGL